MVNFKYLLCEYFACGDVGITCPPLLKVHTLSIEQLQYLPISLSNEHHLHKVIFKLLTNILAFFQYTTWHVVLDTDLDGDNRCDQQVSLTSVSQSPGGVLVLKTVK